MQMLVLLIEKTRGRRLDKYHTVIHIVKKIIKKFSRFEPLSKFSHFYNFRFPAMKTRPRKRGRLTAKATRGLEQLRTNTV